MAKRTTEERLGHVQLVRYLEADGAAACPLCKRTPQLMIRVNTAGIADFLCACFDCRRFSHWAKGEKEAVLNWNKQHKRKMSIREWAEGRSIEATVAAKVLELQGADE